MAQNVFAEAIAPEIGISVAEILRAYRVFVADNINSNKYYI